MDNWNYLYKLDKNFPDETVETNLLYTPYYANGILKIHYQCPFGVNYPRIFFIKVFSGRVSIELHRTQIWDPKI